MNPNFQREMQEKLDAKFRIVEQAIGAPLTDREKQEFNSYSADSIIGVKLIRGMSSDEIKAALGDPAKGEALRKSVGVATNPSWVVSIAIETLYMRNEIDETKLDYFMEYGTLGEIEL